MQRVRTPKATKETVKTKPSSEYGVLQHSAILGGERGKAKLDWFNDNIKSCTQLQNPSIKRKRREVFCYFFVRKSWGQGCAVACPRSLSDVPHGGTVLPASGFPNQKSVAEISLDSLRHFPLRTIIVQTNIKMIDNISRLGAFWQHSHQVKVGNTCLSNG